MSAALDVLDLRDRFVQPEPGEAVAPWFDGSQPCAGTDPDIFFPDKGGGVTAARRICSGCHFRSPCLEYGLNTRIHGMLIAGVWGGRSVRERQKMVNRGITTVSEPSPPPPTIPVRETEPIRVPAVRLPPRPAVTPRPAAAVTPPPTPGSAPAKQPRRPHGAPIDHGSQRGYTTHQRRRVPIPAGDPCGCRKAHSEYMARWRQGAAAQETTERRPVPVDVAEMLAAAQRSPRRAVARAAAMAIGLLVQLQIAPAAALADGQLARHLEDALHDLARAERTSR